MNTASRRQFHTLLLAALFSGPALAECPATMPYQLLQDCIVYEGAGTVFPSGDYAYMGQYLEWQRKQASSEPVLQESSPLLVATPAGK